MSKTYAETVTEPVGSFRRGSIGALRSSANFLLARFERARCDSDGVSCCIRCNSVYLARKVLEALDEEKPATEIKE